MDSLDTKQSTIYVKTIRGCKTVRASDAACSAAGRYHN